MVRVNAVGFCVVLSACAVLAACNSQSRTQAGQTPAPSNTTAAQANSTESPVRLSDRMTSQEHYVAKTSGNLHGVTFGLWSNGAPILAFSSPNMSIDVTKDLRVHANRVAITWHRIAKDGTGTLTISTSTGKTVVAKAVNASTPARGQQTFPMFANP